MTDVNDAAHEASWAFLLAVGVLTLGSLALFYTEHVTVKLLPFDNKSELSVTIDLPEGSSVEATDAVAQAVAAKVLELKEVRSVQTHAATAARAGWHRPRRTPLRRPSAREQGPRSRPWRCRSR